ncbi:hypothetical protein BZM27_35600 [Paraburkholderia steynii]|uniref:Uncharacterized protein n=1 Tax=Paraburkholderia steynii TaxID=1245441 RepID=A0A4R0X8F0_9BURK|nr:hypothetical protein BZM27_35600 [Paraburkholderia steynii]
MPIFRSLWTGFGSAPQKGRGETSSCSRLGLPPGAGSGEQPHSLKLVADDMSIGYAAPAGQGSVSVNGHNARLLVEPFSSSPLTN